MRWPWQRKEPDPAPVTPPEASSVEPPATPSRPPVDPVPSPTGWAFLPPLQRTVRDFETTTAPHRFPDQLPTRTDPSFTGTMSHLISAEAPPGVIDLDGPDAGPVPGGPGFDVRPAEMPLLAPAPRRAAGRPAVQRLTGSGPTVQRSLTSVSGESFGVLRLPVVPEPSPAPATPGVPPAPGPPAEPASAGTAPGDTDGSASDPDGSTPEEGSGEVPTVAAPADVGALGPGPAAAPTSGPVPAGRPGPTLSGLPLPLQRRAEEPPTRPPGGPTSSFDGSATSVPLPARPVVQRSSTADTDSAPIPVPSRPSSPPARSFSPSAGRLGLGRPWPEPVRSSSTADETVPPAVQRAPASPSADGSAPPAVQRAPAPPEHTAAHSAAPFRPAPAGPELGPAAPGELERPGPMARAAAPVVDAGQGGQPGGDGPGPSSPSAPPPRAVALPEPVVSRSAVAEHIGPAPQGGSHGAPPNSTTGSEVRPAPQSATVRAPFSDPPLFAGRQFPDPRRTEALLLVSRTTTSADVAVDRVPAAESPPQDGGHEADGRHGAALAVVPPSGGASFPVRSPAAPPHDSVQRSAEPGTAAPGSAPAGSGPAALAFSTAPDRPRIDAAEGPRALPGAPAESPSGRSAGWASPAALPVVSRSPAPPETAAPSTDGTAGGTAGGTAEEVAGAAVDEVARGTVSSGAGPTGEFSSPSTATKSVPVVSRTAAAESPPTARPADAPSGHRADGSASGPAPRPSAAPALPRVQAPPASRAAHRLGLRPPLPGPVVSRAVDGAPVPGATVLRPRISAAAAAAPAVSRTAAPDLVLPSGRGEDFAPGPGAVSGSGPRAGTEEPRVAAADRAEEISLDGFPSLAVSAGPATVPARGAGGSPGPFGADPAPVGVLQRATGRGEPPYAAGTQLPVGLGATGTDPVAMRLVAPEPPGTGRRGEPLASTGSVTPRSPVAVQREVADVAPETGHPAAAPPPTGTAPSGAPAEPAPPAAPAAPVDGAMSQEQVEELAKRLVGPIVRRIKADMLLDRERRGLRIDAS